MNADTLYALVDLLFPPIAVAVLAFVTTIVILVKALRGGRARAAIIAAGTGNVSLVYFWVHIKGLSAEERALAIRLAIVFCILYLGLSDSRPPLAPERHAAAQALMSEGAWKWRSCCLFSAWR